MHVLFFNGLWSHTEKDPDIYFNRTMSCYQLKHWIAQFEIQSQVIDFCQLLSGENLIEMAEKFVTKETFTLAFSVTFWPTDKRVPSNIQTLIDYARDRWPHLKIVAGGARTPHIIEMFDDYFVGQSEDKFTAWCQHQLGLSSVENRRFNIVQLQHRFDINDCILPDEVLPLELGRGCIFKCKFCSHENLGKSKFTYQRKHQFVLDEIQYNKEMFGTTRYSLLDDTVNEDLEKIKNLSEIQDRLGFRIEWNGYLRADLVWSKPESIEYLAESGMRSCFFGIETLNNKAGVSISKSWGAKKGREFLPELYERWNKKINIQTSLIAGLPHETLQSLKDTFKWCSETDIGWHRFNPLTLYIEKKDLNATSEFTRNYKDYGYVDVNEDTGTWKSNTGMTSQLAGIYAHNYNRLLNRTVNRVSSWMQFSAINLGFTIDEVQMWKHSEFLEKTSNQIPVFVDRYLTKLRAV